MSILRVVATVALAALVSSAPSPQSVGSDLTILLHNDLYGNASIRTAAVLVISEPSSNEQARKKCESLAESLWAPDASNGDSQVGFLKALKKNSQYDLFFIEGKSRPGCKAITPNGKVQDVSCGKQLPALCSQSAPLSTEASLDKSPKWQTTVKSDNHFITGFRDKFSFRFQGVRYANQPKRFTYSSPYDQSESKNVSALDFPPYCVQGSCSGSTSCSEDCLFLNIWTPYLPKPSKTPSTNLKPILLWIHGGAFTGGMGSDPTFDGGSMASRGDVVMVAINYRLSTLGFLALEDGVTNGNYGLADIITALQWVRNHIRDFGGDPSRITIVGQSAGAAAVRALIASPKAKGLFAAAIPMSTPIGSNYAESYSKYYTIGEEVAVAGKAILNATGCGTAASPVECLRNYDALKLVTLADVARYIVVDGTYVTSKGLPLGPRSTAAKVPLLAGYTRDDGVAFMGRPKPTDTLESYLTSSGYNASLIISNSDLFPLPAGSNNSLAMFNLTGEITTLTAFSCLTHATTWSGVRYSIFPRQFSYVFNRSYQMRGYSPNSPACEAPRTPSHPFGDPKQEYYKCHSGELLIAFGNLAREGYPLRDDDDIPFSQYVLDSWASFVSTYDPNPSRDFLEDRRYTNTTAALRNAGKWPEVRNGGRDLVYKELIAGGGVEKKFGDNRKAEQCKVLGFPFDYFENNES